MRDIITTVINEMCTFAYSETNIHYHFTSHIRGCIIYRIFRGAKWVDRLISPWEDDLE